MNNTHFPLANEWYDAKSPKVSIVILNFNKPLLTIDCLRSIWNYTSKYRYEIIVVDNGSRLHEYGILAAFPGQYTLLRLDINRFFGEGNNIGAQHAVGDFVVFMNNDVTVSENWLPPLVEVFDRHPDCGAAGPKFVYPNGLLQEAGALLDPRGGSVQIGKFQDPDSPRFAKERVVDYVSAAAVIMRKRTFEEVLGFDFMYEPAYYEDADLCLKIGKQGLKTYYVPTSFVVHHENATTSDKSNGLKLNNIVAINQKKFVTRWHSYLATGRHAQRAEPTKVLRKNEIGCSKTAALFTPYNIIPGGGERYLLATAETFLKAGYEVWLITPEEFSYIRITRIAAVLGLDLNGINLVTQRVAETMPAFDVFFAIGNEIVPPIRALGGRNFYCCQFPFPISDTEYECRREWLQGYQKVIVYSEFVKKRVSELFLKRKLPHVPIEIIEPPVDMVSRSPDADINIRSGIVSVGRFFTGGHCKQQDMMIRAFRKLYESGVNCELYLVGSLPPESEHRDYFIHCQQLASGLPVHFHLDAPHETLVALYQSSSLYWHGAGFGVDTDQFPEKCEHFGISVVEAMSSGLIPLVVNNGGPALTVQHGINGYCYASEDELVELSRAALSQSDKDTSEMRRLAIARAQMFSKPHFDTRWKELLTV